MNILGVVKIPTIVNNTGLVVHEFKVLDTRSYANILMGRDFLQLFNSVKFDFRGNRVQLGKSWVPCVNLKTKETVRVNEYTIIKERSEQVISVRCHKRCGVLSVDIEPRRIPGLQGVFASKARVLPNLDGTFYVSLLNVNENDATICPRKIVGFIQSNGEVVQRANSQRSTGEATLTEVMQDITFGADQNFRWRLCRFIF